MKIDKMPPFHSNMVSIYMPFLANLKRSSFKYIFGYVFSEYFVVLFVFLNSGTSVAQLVII